MDCLARLGVDRGLLPTDSGEASAGSQAVIVILPAIITGLTPALAQLAKGRRGVAVLLEGFVPAETPEEAIASLRGSNLEIIHCSPGSLEATIDKLSSSLSFDGELSGGGGKYVS